MIIVRIGIQDGEREYTDWNYYQNFNQTDYLEGEITDREILSEFWGVAFGDNDYFDKEDPHDESYWYDTSCVWVESVENISENDLETLKRYLI